MNDYRIKNSTLTKYLGNETVIRIPETVTSIGADAFTGKRNIREIIIPESVTRIGNSAFFGCDYLKRITIPNSVTCIGKNVFSFCWNLSEIIIPECAAKNFSQLFSHCPLSAITYRGITFSPDSYQNIKIDKVSLLNTHRTVETETVLKFIDTQEFPSYIPKEVRFLILWDLFIRNPEQKDIYLLIRGNFVRMFRFLIDENDIQTAQNVIDSGKFINKKNIDKLIQYAIDQKETEIQVLLTDYKANHIGYDSDEQIIRKKFTL